MYHGDWRDLHAVIVAGCSRVNSLLSGTGRGGQQGSHSCARPDILTDCLGEIKGKNGLIVIVRAVRYCRVAICFSKEGKQKLKTVNT